GKNNEDTTHVARCSRHRCPGSFTAQNSVINRRISDSPNTSEQLRLHNDCTQKNLQMSLAGIECGNARQQFTEILMKSKAGTLVGLGVLCSALAFSSPAAASSIVFSNLGVTNQMAA